MLDPLTGNLGLVGPAVPRLPPGGNFTAEPGVCPSHAPVCPACDDVTTFWRGPHPKVGETMVEYHRDGELFTRIARGLRSPVKVRDPERGEVTLWRLAVAPERERDEMYLLVDVLVDRPLWLPHRGAWLWQPALCQRDEADHKAAWYEAVYPPNPPLPAERKRGRRPAAALESHDADEDAPF